MVGIRPVTLGQFITYTVYVCVQHYVHEAARCVGLSATAKTVVCVM